MVIIGVITITIVFKYWNEPNWVWDKKKDTDTKNEIAEKLVVPKENNKTKEEIKQQMIAENIFK